jgi:predicted flap endonuclease-1-like 5' DNA nuclease
MDTTTLILIGGLILGLACFIYIYFGAQRLYRSREARVRDNAPASPAPAAGPAPPAAPPSGSGQPAEAADAPPSTADDRSPFLSAPDGPADDLMRIKGIGPKLSARLGELGVFHYSQIAGWTAGQLAQVDAQLGTFQGRPTRDQWQSQARLLASGDMKAYERAHGKLEQPARGPEGPLDPAPGGPAA